MQRSLWGGCATAAHNQANQPMTAPFGQSDTADASDSLKRLDGLRILALAGEFPPYPGGIGTYAYNMAEAATALGAEVTVLAPDYGKLSSDDADAPFKIIRFPGGEHSNKQLPAKILLARSVIR